MFIETYEAEYIEQKVTRITESNEPITDGAQMIYTNAKDGVIKAYDIRTDKWEIAQDAMNSVNKQSSKIPPKHLPIATWKGTNG